ncbi:MAG: LysM peptidoglycan-binding domain-containing protein [Calothrix sp. MO_167.B42]|nr:LysM peptidoglycan-binding domain-containing protein [Calothrix sp. MO_167.B42]
MTNKLNCPVCGYTGIEGNNCPNCDTDLSLISILQELPILETSLPKSQVSRWQLVTAGLILLIGMGLGILSSFVFMQPQVMTASVTVPSPVIITTPNPELNSIAPKVSSQPPEPLTYTVKAGEHLSGIAEKFCGRGTSWQVMVEANPQLKGREDYIDVGEVFKIPNCKENTG